MANELSSVINSTFSGMHILTGDLGSSKRTEPGKNVLINYSLKVVLYYEKTLLKFKLTQSSQFQVMTIYHQGFRSAEMYY